MAIRCPFCNSEYTFFSPRRELMVCEDCGRTFDMPAEDHPHLRIFFSYGHDRNRIIVERIMEALRERGHEVWIDQERIDVGAEWRRRITEGIMASDEVVSFLSRHSVRNPGVCLDELRIALCVRNADVKTVLLESERDVDPPAAIAGRQWLDMSDWQERWDAGGAAWDAWFATKMDELVACLESAESATFQGELEEVRLALHPLPYGNREHDLLQREFVGRMWLLDHVRTWKSAARPRTFVLWGVPGSGKSSFASHLAHYDPAVAATVFFEYGRKELASFDAVTRLLAYQLASKLPDYRAQLLYVLRNQRGEAEHLHDESLFDLVVGNPLRNSVDGGRAPLVVVLDALDELEELDGDLLPRLLAKLDELPAWVRVLATSRPEPGVVALFEDACTYTLGAEGSEESDADLAAYLAPCATDAATARKLARSCAGSFLFATMLREQIESGRLTVQEALEFKGGLAAFYRLNFVRRFGGQLRFADVRAALELILGAPMLPRHLLCGALGWDVYAFREFRRSLGSFVTLVGVQLLPGQSNTQVVGLVHKSLADWLADEHLAGEFYVDARQGKARLGGYFAGLLRAGSLDELELAERVYVWKNVASLLVDGGQNEAYMALLLDLGDPAMPVWGRVRDLPAHMDVTPLAAHLRATFVDVKERVLHSHLSNSKRFVGCCEALAACVERPEFDEILIDFLLSKDDLWCPTGFFCSSASDCYDHDGLPGIFNLDKIHVAYAVGQCLAAARQRGVQVPEAAMREAQLLKLSSLCIEGAFEEGCATCAMDNLPYLYRDDLCELTERDFDALTGRPLLEDLDVRALVSFYNTYCLYLYLRQCEQVSGEVERHVRRAVDLGADFAQARSLVEEYCRSMVSGTTRFDAHETNVRGVMEHLAVVLGHARRWHPLPPVYVRNLGPLEDYCEVYEFPCCHKTVVTGDGAPSQLREDGCEVLEQGAEA